MARGRRGVRERWELSRARMSTECRRQRGNEKTKITKRTAEQERNEKTEAKSEGQG